MTAAAWLAGFGATATRFAGALDAIDAVDVPGAIALVDPALAQSRLFASIAAHGDTCAIDIIDIQGDAGALWHAQLSRRGAPLAGVLRGADFFVLRHLATSTGRRVLHAAECGGSGMRVVAFLIDGCRPGTREA